MTRVLDEVTLDGMAMGGTSGGSRPYCGECRVEVALRRRRLRDESNLWPYRNSTE
jgi:hypothetical protein